MSKIFMPKDVFCKKGITPKMGTETSQPFLTLIFKNNFDVFELILVCFWHVWVWYWEPAGLAYGTGGPAWLGYSKEALMVLGWLGYIGIKIY